MSSVCLSLVANLRCSGLRPAQAIGILIPPIVEAFALSFLIYTQKDKGRKHFLLVFDSYLYLALSVVDFLSKFDNAIATSLSTFSLIDRVIGGLSGVPIFFYTLFLYMFARRYLIPILPHRIKWGVKVLLTLLIPIILLLCELGSLLGISYTVFSPPSKELAIRFESSIWKTLWTLLNSAGLALLILYQFIAFCLATFRIYRHWNRVSSNEGSASGHDGPDRVTLGGVGWVAAGIKLGAIEVLLGFIPNGFGMALPRRLLRLLGRAMIAWGVYKGMDENGGNALFRVVSLDSIEGLPPRRVPVNPTAVRKLIGAPMAETFVKMSPTASTFHTRKNVPNAMRGMNKFDLSFVDEKARSGTPLREMNYGWKEVTPVSIIPALMAQNVAAPAASSAVAPLSPGLRRTEKRVTVAYDGRLAPVLDVRFSAQTFADAGTLMKQIGKHSPSTSMDQSSSDDNNLPRKSNLKQTRPSPPTAYKRSRSTPPSSRRSTIPEEEETERPVPPRLPSQESVSSGSEGKRVARPSLKDTRERRSRSRSSQSKLYNPFADSSEIMSPPLPDSLESANLGLIKRETSTGSTEESLAAIRRISIQFPPLPAGVEALRPEDLPSNKASKRKPPPPMPSPVSRPRSMSQPQLPLSAFASPDLQGGSSPRVLGNNSPRGSLDQDVASRTRRRIRTHMENMSPANSIVGLDEAQWATRTKAIDTPPMDRNVLKKNRSVTSSSNIPTTTTTTASFAFSPRATAVSGRDTRSYGFGRKAENVDEMGRSPTTVYTRESIYSMDELPVERPVGRIARRALGIEQFLDKEKEKSQDGHDAPLSTTQNTSGELAEDVMSPTTPSRKRPRSGVDNTFKRLPKQANANPSASQSGTDFPKQSGEAVDDPVAREAFAAAWRTVESAAASPRFDSLKKVGSVKVQTTPTPTRHHKVFSEHSMKVDEGRMDVPSTASSSQAGAERGRLAEDREYLRKARYLKAASVDSEIY